MAFCQNCGVQLHEASKFCPNCGTPVPVAAKAANARVPPRGAPVAAAVPEPEAAPAMASQAPGVQPPAPQPTAYQPPVTPPVPPQPVAYQPAQPPVYPQAAPQQAAPQPSAPPQAAYPQPGPPQPVYQQPGPQPQGAPAQPAYQQPVPGAVPGEGQMKKGMAVLAYFGILVLIPLLAAKQDPFARYHTNQGLVLFLASVISSVLSNVLTTLLIDISSTAVLIISGVFGILALVWFVFSIIGIVHAAKGQTKPLPLIGGIRLLK